MLRDLFVKKKKYAAIPSEQVRKDVPDGVMTKCPECKNHVYERTSKNLKVCVNCGYHHPMNAWERLDSILDEGSFREYDKEMVSLNPLEFPGYEEKLESDRKKTELNEAVVTGEGTIDDMLVVVAVMDSRFRMGSMGSVVGEKIARAVEKAYDLQVPFIIFTASGGARMQEGILSLMQMAKQA